MSQTTKDKLVAIMFGTSLLVLLSLVQNLPPILNFH